MNQPQTTAPAPHYTASSSGARASFLGLAAALTFAVLASLSGLADRQVEDTQVAQASAQPMACAASATTPHRA